MNKIYFLLSFIFIIILHYFVLTFFYEKKQQQVNKPHFNKVSVQLAMLQVPQKVKKQEVKKKEIKKEQKKKVFKKPLIKQAKREYVKKEIKAPKKVKKKVEKKVEEKLVKKVEKKQVKKVVEKEAKKIEKKASVSKKKQVQSLEKFKKSKKTYLTRLRAEIDSNKKYPILSKRFKEQGTVTVYFRVLKTGEFIDIKLFRSSGKRRLDKAAIKAVEKTKHFEPFSKEIYKPYLDIKVPIKFQIK